MDVRLPGGRLAAVFYPLEHPTPYASECFSEEENTNRTEKIPGGSFKISTSFLKRKKNFLQKFFKRESLIALIMKNNIDMLHITLEK
jgi:hypothetical protein